MKKTIFAAMIAAVAFSCGDAGIGFNVGKEFPVDVPISLPIPGNPLGGLVDIDPDETSFEYDLNEVGAFDDALDGLDDAGSIILNNLAYEITGVDSDEQLDLDELRIDILLPSGTLSFPLATGGSLQNAGKSDIALTETQRNNIVSELFTSNQISSNVVMDLGEIPADPNDREVVFDFVIYFDILLKARDL